MNIKIITELVKASGVSKGELILIHFWGDDADKEIANRFLSAVASLGAAPVLLQQSRAINAAVFSAAKEGCFDERYFDLFSKFDAVLDVFAYQPVILPCKMDAEPFAHYRDYMSRIFNKLMECRRFTQIRLPTQANAEESGLNPQDYIRRMTGAYDIDYQAVKDACRHEIERFSGACKVSVHTGTDCVLRLELEERTWQTDAGDGDLPCGEVYIAPVEDKSQGALFFETFYLDDRSYRNVTIQIKDGRFCGSNTAEIDQYFAEQTPENRVLCELGIGMNPGVTDLCGYTVLDEKMAGTFHIAFGANNMFGGANAASHHIDFVGHGEIEVTE